MKKIAIISIMMAIGYAAFSESVEDTSARMVVILAGMVAESKASVEQQADSVAKMQKELSDSIAALESERIAKWETAALATSVALPIGIFIGRASAGDGYSACVGFSAGVGIEALGWLVYLAYLSQDHQTKAKPTTQQ